MEQIYTRTPWYWCYLQHGVLGFGPFKHGQIHFAKHYSTRQITPWTWGIALIASLAARKDSFGSQMLQGRGHVSFAQFGSTPRLAQDFGAVGSGQLRE